MNISFLLVFSLYRWHFADLTEIFCELATLTLSLTILLSSLLEYKITEFVASNTCFWRDFNANVFFYVACTTGVLSFQKTAVGTYLCMALSCILELSERLLQTYLKWKYKLQLSNCYWQQAENCSLLTSH